MYLCVFELGVQLQSEPETISTIEMGSKNGLLKRVLKRFLNGAPRLFCHIYLNHAEPCHPSSSWEIINAPILPSSKLKKHKRSHSKKVSLPHFFYLAHSLRVCAVLIFIYDFCNRGSACYSSLAVSAFHLRKQLSWKLIRYKESKPAAAIATLTHPHKTVHPLHHLTHYVIIFRCGFDGNVADSWPARCDFFLPGLVCEFYRLWWIFYAILKMPVLIKIAPAFHFKGEKRVKKII